MPARNAKTSIFVDGAWTDISSYTYVREPITIGRGRSDEGQSTDPSTCGLTLNNRDGRFSPRLPTSQYYGKIGRNTPARVAVNGDPEPVRDTFTRSVSNGWGTADSGQAWLTEGGAASDRSVNGSAGVVTLAATPTVARNQYTADTLTDADVVVAITPQQVATGASMIPQILLRRDSDVTYYAARMLLTTGGTVDVDVTNTVDLATSATVATGITYTTGTKLWMRARILGQTIRVRVWKDGTTEPLTWQVKYTVTDASLPEDTIASGSVGVNAQVNTGNTNASPVFHFDSITATDLAKIRMVGEVANWPIRWDKSGNDITAPTEVNGMLRRLGQGSSPLRSAIYRELTSPSRPTPLAYWPLEDGSGSHQVASAVDGQPMKVETGTPNFESSEVFACSAPLPTVGDAWLRGYVGPYTPNGTTIARVFVHVPAAATASQEVFSLRCTGSAELWLVRYMGAGGDLQVEAYTSDDVALLTSSANHNIDGVPCSLELKLVQNGANIDWRLLTTRIIDEVIFSAQISGTLNNRTVGRVLRSSLNYNRGLTDVAMGHLAITNDTALFADTEDVLIGWTGERAGRRIERLCAEAEIPFESVGDLDATEQMGPQRPGQFVELLQEAADADGGILYETRHELGLSYRTRESMYNQDPAATFDYAAGDLAPPLEPEEDDQHIRNDVTVERVGGSSARVVQETGPLSTLAPPDGVGTYDDQVSLSLFADTQCGDHAGWRVHLGTWDEARFSAVSVNLAAHPELAAAATKVEVGDLIVIKNPPAFLPPGDIALIVQGYTEVTDGISWMITFNCTPGGPWTVGVLDDAVLGRLDTDGSELAASLGGEGTGTVSVAALTGGGSSVDGTTFNTASISPAANALLAVWIAHTATDPPTVTLTGLGLSWKRQASKTISAATRFECWTAQCGPEPGSGALTITTAVTATSLVWNVNQVTGHSIGNGVRAANVKTSNGSGTAPSLTFSAAQYTNNRFIVGFGASANITQTPRASWTELGDNSITGPSVSLETQWRSDTAETTASSTMSGSSLWAGIGLELVAGGAKTFTVAVTDGPLWTTDAAEFPFDVKIGGELMTVSTITGASSPQTFTVTRHVNAAVKAHPAGADVRLAHPLILGL